MKTGLAQSHFNLDVKWVTKLGHDKWHIHLGRGLRRICRFLSCKDALRKDKRKELAHYHNCQRHGHISTNCGMGYICVKTSGTLGPGKCTIPAGADGRRDVATSDPVTRDVLNSAEFTLKCANCNVEGHSANARDCPKRLALLAKRNEQKMENVQVVRTILQQRISLVRPGVS